MPRSPLEIVEPCMPVNYDICFFLPMQQIFFSIVQTLLLHFFLQFFAKLASCTYLLTYCEYHDVLRAFPGLGLQFEYSNAADDGVYHVGGFVTQKGHPEKARWLTTAMAVNTVEFEASVSTPDGQCLVKHIHAIIVDR